jgi:hypothetical protein
MVGCLVIYKLGASSIHVLLPTDGDWMRSPPTTFSAATELAGGRPALIGPV